MSDGGYFEHTTVSPEAQSEPVARQAATAFDRCLMALRLEVPQAVADDVERVMRAERQRLLDAPADWIARQKAMGQRVTSTEDAVVNAILAYMRKDDR